MKHYDKGYSVFTVIYLITIASLMLTLCMIWVSIYISKTTKNLNHFTKWDDQFEIIEELLDNFGTGIGDEYTSPYSGWFSDFPTEIEDCTIDIEPEDSKLDINHHKLEFFYKVKSIEDQKKKKDGFGTNTGMTATFDPEKGFIFSSTPTPTPFEMTDDIVFEEEEYDDYIYEPTEMNDNLHYKNHELIHDHFTIYSVPNLNTADPDRLELYLMTKGYDENFIKTFLNKLQQFRRNAKNYMKTTPKNQENLLIQTRDLEQFKSLKWDDPDDLYRLFDIEGRINLNFVNEEVFTTVLKACDPGQNIDRKIEGYWKKVQAYRDEEKEIKKMDVQNIFGNDLQYYKKVISIDSFSKFFKITINKGKKVLTVWVRRYKTREIHTEIIKVSALDTSIRPRKNKEPDATDDTEEATTETTTPDSSSDIFFDPFKVFQ